MHHILIIKNGNTNNIVKEILVDGQMYVDETPRKNSDNLITSGAVKKGMDNILDDNDPESVSDLLITKEDYDTYELGKFYVRHGSISVCTERSRTGEEGDYRYSVILTKLNGVVLALNNLVDRINSLETRIAALENN